MTDQQIKDAMEKWIQLFIRDLESFDDLLYSNKLVSFACNVMGLDGDIKHMDMNREVLERLCDHLRNLANIRFPISNSFVVEVPDLLIFTQVLYVYTISISNNQEYIEPILNNLSQDCQSVLEGVYNAVISDQDGKYSAGTLSTSEFTNIPLENTNVNAQQEQLLQELATMRREIEEMKSQHTAEINSLNERLYLEGMEADELRQSLQQTKDSLEHASKTLADLPQMERKLREQSTELELAKEQVQVLTSEQTKLRKYESLCQQYQTRIGELQERCNAIQVRIVYFIILNDDMSLEGEIERLRACDSEVIRLRQELKETQKSLATSEQGLKSVTSQLVNTVSENEELKSKLNIMKGDMMHYRQQAQQEKEKEQENEDMADIPSKRLRTEISLNSVLEVSPKLQSEVSRLQAERDLLLARVQALEKEKESKIDESALAVLREKAAALEQHHRESIRHCTELEHRCEELEKHVDRSEEQYQQCALQVEDLRGQIIEYQNSISALEDQCHDAQIRTQNLQTQIVEIEKTYEEKLDESDLQYWDVVDRAYSDRAFALAICERVQQQHVQQMQEAMASWKQVRGELETELEGLKEQLQKRDAMIAVGKAQLERLQNMANEANEAASTARKECEVATTKNAQLTRELFLLRRERGGSGGEKGRGMQSGVGGAVQSEEYVVLLRANEELTKRIEQLQAEKEEAGANRFPRHGVGIARSSATASATAQTQLMVTLDQRIRTLEDENRTLTMSKSQLLQNKHILEQQLDEVVKESSTMKTEMTRLQLQLQRIKQMAEDKQYKELQQLIMSIRIKPK